MAAMKPFAGVHTPIVTPFTADDRLDEAALRSNVAKWMATPLTGLVVLGSNGETTSQIDVTWTTPDAAVASIQIEIREQGGTAWQTVADRFDHEAGIFTTTAMVGGLTHEVRARYKMWGGIGGPWSTVTVTSIENNRSSGVVGYLTDESVIFEADSSGNIL